MLLALLPGGYATGFLYSKAVQKIDASSYKHREPAFSIGLILRYDSYATISLPTLSSESFSVIAKSMG